MPLPLRTRLFWAVYRPLERRPVLQQPADRIAAARKARRRALALPGARLLTGGRDPGAEVRETTFAAPDGTPVGLRIYRPRVAAAGPSKQRLPVVVYFHGGGWVSGDPQQSDWWTSGVAVRAGVVVVSVDYRLAPEHPFPTPVEDGYAATTWVAANAATLGVDASRLAVMGDSAGGNMAAAVSLFARDRSGPAIAAQVLIYPSVRLHGDFASARENTDAPVLTPRDMVNAATLYLGDDGDADDPAASPLLAEHHGLPPALIQTAQYDPLRDEGAAYAAALRRAGVPVRYTEYAGAVHGYASLPGAAPAAHQALSETVAFLGETLAGS